MTDPADPILNRSVWEDRRSPGSPLVRTSACGARASGSQLQSSFSAKTLSCGTAKTFLGQRSRFLKRAEMDVPEPKKRSLPRQRILPLVNVAKMKTRSSTHQSGCFELQPHQAEAHEMRRKIKSAHYRSEDHGSSFPFVLKAPFCPQGCTTPATRASVVELLRCQTYLHVQCQTPSAS
ncbi:unnamed protein product [Nesidiocoris tenuis]|uniref:Uncharacterized protein n=1 Tax=Nesidiocoris tenuis TaxID=355587 RepID=A0A6H5HGJ2_9HEMI|nr:unnamed protein product [Nesidiocoris tenuis]CAB0015757.1 unnamed protein product [Nesidiocoris tenuis]